MKMYKSEFRVYWEDTDAGGVVYYSNYLKFAERARTEVLRENGILQTELGEKEDVYFVVRHAELSLKKPARLDDMITIETQVTRTANASFNMLQKIYLNTIELAEVKIKIACVNSAMKPTRLPGKIKNLFA